MNKSVVKILYSERQLNTKETFLTYVHGAGKLTTVFSLSPSV